MAVQFTTVKGQRININCDPNAYTYAIAEENGIVRIKFPDVPEFEIYEREQDLVLQRAEAEKAEKEMNYLLNVLKLLMGKSRNSSHPIFHTLFMPGDIWEVRKVGWKERSEHYFNHFYGLKPGDQFEVSIANWGEGYYAGTSSLNPKFDPKIIKGVMQTILERPPTQAEMDFDVCVMWPHNVTEGHVVFMGNPTVKEPRWFGCEKTGKILLPIGKPLSIPPHMLEAAKGVIEAEQKSTGIPLGIVGG
ncbi:hypothetical protein [Pseudomonas putida]|uniref:Uncharacterized protein n=1 Tax=Pseudomonas putida TaxID=303 RepID=A0A8I1EBZ3_PSEPU|nr:hypothetical protein [Pseudomonas putida]MBI6883242.1 hypothetical protein [Pseudomonas putida]